VKDSPEKIQEIIDRLFGQLVQGTIYFYCSKSLHEAFQEGGLIRWSYLFNGVYLASVNEAVLALSRVVIEDESSITIHYLFNYAEHNPRLFSSQEIEDVRRSAETHKKRLQKYEQLIQSVKEQRDRVLAHLDKKHVNDPSALFSYPQGVNLTELGECLQELLDIFNFYAGYYDRGFDPGHLKEAISGDVDVLLRWMKEYGKPEEWIRHPVFN
jgi:hypothetical protein